jgi:hypothetical protein
MLPQPHATRLVLLDDAVEASVRALEARCGDQDWQAARIGPPSHPCPTGALSNTDRGSSAMVLRVGCINAWRLVLAWQADPNLRRNRINQKPYASACFGVINVILLD